MQPVEFYKMSGCGNDFILVDNRTPVIDEGDLEQFVAALCRRGSSVGADGLILIESSEDLDFQWRFFNSDGSRAEMCGNGARCAARYAFLNRIAPAEMTFGTDVGPLQARIIGEDVKLKMPRPKSLRLAETLSVDGKDLTVSAIDTGVPHVVLTVDDLPGTDVVSLGRAIRNHDHYAPEGTNVNFLGPLADHTLAIRTYERGVEQETLACGTGAVAGTLITACKENLDGPLNIRTQSGKILQVHFKRQGERFQDVYLQGEARLVYHGRLTPEAWS